MHSFNEIYNTFFPVVSAALLGALIGLERELAGKDASLRTFMIICLGSCLFTVGGKLIAEEIGDPGRVSAQIVTGIGFLGAGAIFRSNVGIEGLTTAALIWLTASIGLLCGIDQVFIASISTVIAIFFLWCLNVIHLVIRRLRPEYYHNLED